MSPSADPNALVAGSGMFAGRKVTASKSSFPIW
jgi:hypothetical protein